MLKHIFTDPLGIVCFDDYFAHVESLKGALPPTIYAFASDVSRYVLQGTRTLHDAWVENLSFRVGYMEASNEIETSSLNLDLRQAQGGMIRMTYGGVSAWSFSGAPERWPDHAVDLLAHEFDVVSDSLFAHRLAFDRNVSLEVLFRTFSFEETES